LFFLSPLNGFVYALSVFLPVVVLTYEVLLVYANIISMVDLEQNLGAGAM